MIDLSAVSKATLPIIELVLGVMQACGEFSLKYGLVGSQVIRDECRNFQETQNWLFANSFEEALAMLK